MAFLDNSGDIILDVVLTDHGRKVMAKGDGSFQITKFAVCDEEIDYSLYNSSHGSGSAYYDLEILQTPILEAFTNNTSTMNTKLASFENLNLLYLPVLKLNEVVGNTSRHVSGSYFVAVDRRTEGTDTANENGAVGFSSAGQPIAGILFGASMQKSNTIRVDQGIDSSEISPKQVGLMRELIEDFYVIQMDNRLGRIATSAGSNVGFSYVDDDNIAFYEVGRASGLVMENNSTEVESTQTISGPRGSILEFKIGSSIELNTSNYLFTKLGGEMSLPNKGGSYSDVRFIDSTIKITGMKTGYSIDVPIRYIKIK